MPDFFNASNDNNNFDNRSDNKGPEPEAIATGEFNGRTYAFIGLERIGGVMVYDVTIPSMPFFVQYLNNRDFNEDPENGNPGDLGVEDLKFIAPEDSPNGKALLVSSNEVSGTVTIFQIDDPTIEFQTDRHNRILLLQREGDNVQLINQLTGEIFVDQPLEATHSIEITGLERFKDKLTIDFDHGGSFHLPGGVKFDGISGADRLLMFATDEALRAILGQWQRTDISYLARIDVIRNGNGVPPLTNFDNLVFDDWEEDTLDGQTSLDWYFEGRDDELIPDPVPELADDEVIEMLP